MVCNKNKHAQWKLLVTFFFLCTEVFFFSDHKIYLEKFSLNEINASYLIIMICYFQYKFIMTQFSFSQLFSNNDFNNYLILILEVKNYALLMTTIQSSSIMFAYIVSQRSKFTKNIQLLTFSIIHFNFAFIPYQLVVE